jgi:DNA polymerase III subunit delta
MEAGALLRELAAGRVPRLLLLHGPEPLLVDELVVRVADCLFQGQDDAAWNREVVHADSVAPDALVAAGSGLPLFGGRRLLLVRGLAEAPAKAIEHLREALEAAGTLPCGWPAEGTTVLLTAAGATRRTPALRLVGETHQVEVRAPTGRALVTWLRERAARAGLDLLPEAAEALIELCGEDVGRLAGEIEKAALFADCDARVTAATVRALAGESRVRRHWELRQALENQDRAAALRVLEALLEAHEEPLVLLAQVVGYVRDVWRARAGVAQRMDARTVAGLLKPRRPEWAVEPLMAQAAGWSADALAGALARCFEVEQRLKSGGGNPRALLTTLVTDLGGT